MKGREYSRGCGSNVVVKARDDLFEETSEKIVCADGTELDGIQLFRGNSVTSIPDNVGCCEVVGVGRDCQNVKVGDVVFCDFADVRQGFVLDTAGSTDEAERYVIPDECMKCRFDPETGEVEPLAGFVITRAAPERMKVALNGTDRLEVPAYILTDGIVSGYDSDGQPCAWTRYEEVVKVGPPEVASHTRPMHWLERRVLDMLAKNPGEWVEYDAVDAEEAALINEYLAWRRAPRELDLKPGDLVPYCSDFATKIRVRGEFLHIVPQRNVLCVIDDAAMLDDAIREGKAGRLKLVS